MTCDLCGREFKGEAGLRTHMGWKHPGASVRPPGIYGVRVDCSHCGRKMGVRPVPHTGVVASGICGKCVAEGLRKA